MEGKQSVVDLECYSLQRAGCKVLIMKAVVKLAMGFFQIVLLCIETLCKQATSVALLTNFSFEFFMKFSQKMPLNFNFTMMQKSEND